MKLNKIGVFYWKVICNIKSFDLLNKKFRLLIVVFWMMLFSSLYLIGYYSTIFYKQHKVFTSDKDVIETFEAKFALNRFLEGLTEEVRTLSDKVNGEDKYLVNLIQEDFIPTGYDRNDISNILDKIFIQIVTRSVDADYSYNERKLIDKLSKKLKIPNDQSQPSSDLVNNCCVYFDLVYGLVKKHQVDESIYDQITVFYNKIRELIDMSNTFSIAYKDTLNEHQFLSSQNYIQYWIKEPDTLSFNTGINFDNISKESAIEISKTLSYYCTIGYYKTMYAVNRSTESFYPDYLIESFTKLSFFEPEGFNPSDFKGNLERAKNKIEENAILYYKFLMNLLIIFGAHIVFIVLIRIVNWINNG